MSVDHLCDGWKDRAPPRPEAKLWAHLAASTLSHRTSCWGSGRGGFRGRRSDSAQVDPNEEPGRWTFKSGRPISSCVP